MVSRRNGTVDDSRLVILDFELCFRIHRENVNPKGEGWKEFLQLIKDRLIYCLGHSLGSKFKVQAIILRSRDRQSLSVKDMLNLNQRCMSIEHFKEVLLKVFPLSVSVAPS